MSSQDIFFPLHSFPNSQRGQTPKLEYDESTNLFISQVTAILSSHNALRRSISAGTYVAKGKKMPAAVTPIPDLVWITRVSWRNKGYWMYFGERLYEVKNIQILSL